MKNVFTFNGRSNRSKYILCCFVASIIGLISYTLVFYIKNTFTCILAFLIYIAYITSITCLTVQRLHDIDRPQNHYWLCFIPIYNIYLGFLLLFKKGTNGQNQYGKNPLNLKEIA